MAITFRETKGSPLTHTELDQNFKEFFFSSSYIGESARPYGVTLFQSKSLNSGTDIFFPQAIGNNYQIQIKSGSSNVSSSFLTGSSNFQFNYDSNHLSISGSGELSGNLVVLGTVTAQEFKSELVSSSILFDSGSSLFGNSADDIHTFTGSVRVSNGITGSLLSTNGVLSSSAQIATDISGSSTTLSSSIAADIAVNSATSASLQARVTSNESSVTSLNSSTGSYLLNTTDTLNGDLTVTGTLTAQQFNTEYVTSSVILQSGSTQFGDSADDVHTFTGSVNISGSTTMQALQADVINATTINATVSGSIDQATTASFSTTSVSASNASTASTVNFNGGLTTTSDVQFDSFGVGTAASGTTGEIRATGDITAYYSSDERLKDNITPLSDAINKIDQINGYEFDWNSNSSHSGHDVGVIAQEIEKVLPEVVVTRDNGYKAVRYEKIVALLISAIKEQQLQINELKSKL